jgi:hypothetical protein
MGPIHFPGVSRKKISLCQALLRGEQEDNIPDVN